MSDLLSLAERVLARTVVGEDLEVFVSDRRVTTVRAYDGAVESLSQAGARGIGVRVLSAGAFGYAHTTDLTDPGLADVLAHARANAAAADPDEANVLPDAADAAPLPGLADPDAATVGPEEKVALALALEAAVRDAGAPVKGVDAAIVGDTIARSALVSTRGIAACSDRSEAYCLVEALCEADGASTSAYGARLARNPRALGIAEAAAEAVERAARLLGGRKPPSGPVPVVLDPHVTAALLGVLADALTAEAVQRGRSLFAGRVGERLAPGFVDLVDDGRHPDGPASDARDGEGVPTGRTALLRGGVLAGFLHDSRTAARDGVASTGNAVRAGHQGPPAVGPTNLYLAPGTATPEELLAEAGTGFYCQQVMGLHSGADPTSGQLSVGASGLMIRDGVLAEPVREATIAGTIPDLLAGIVTVGADFGFVPTAGGVGGQTLLVDGLTLSGA